MVLQESEGKRSLPRKARSCGKFIIKNDYYKIFQYVHTLRDLTTHLTRHASAQYITTKVVVDIYSLYNIHFYLKVQPQLTLQVYQNESIWFTRTFQGRSQAPFGAVRRPKRAALFLFLSIHIIDIVGYSKQVTLYYTRLAGVVTGEAFLFLASVTTLFLIVCVIHMILFYHNLQCQ